MIRFIVRRLIAMVGVVLVLSVLLFVWLRSLPGGTGLGHPRRARHPDAGARRSRRLSASTSRSTCST